MKSRYITKLIIAVIPAVFFTAACTQKSTYPDDIPVAMGPDGKPIVYTPDGIPIGAEIPEQNCGPSG